MNIACIIPARGGSKGIPHKNIKDFCGRPLIQWSILQALEVGGIEPYVSTDDRAIAEKALEAGAKIIERPPELSTDNCPLEPVLLHASDLIDKNVETILLLQPTSPLRHSCDIENAIEIYKLGCYQSVFSASIEEDICLWKETSHGLDSFTYDFENRGRRQERSPYFLENGSIYVFDKKNLYKDNRLGGKIGYVEMPRWKSFEIDNMEDWRICEFFMREMILEQK